MSGIAVRYENAAGPGVTSHDDSRKSEWNPAGAADLIADRPPALGDPSGDDPPLDLVGVVQ
jgi:hypothetical protein